MHRHIVQLNATSELVRKEKINGKEHLVVPVVALVEGVYQCATCPTPELYLAEEFGKQVASWNGRPVTFNHPMRDNQYISAGDPDVFEVEKLGTIFNSKLDQKKLKMEAWIDLDALESKPQEMKDLVAALEKGDKVEVSTGYFSDVRPAAGKFNGKDYSGVQVSILPDHLALLDKNKTGACSQEDGCGAPRVNCGCQQPKEPQTNHLTLDGVVNALFELSDRDKRAALETVLLMQDGCEWDYIIALFNDTFVYYHHGKLHQRGYSIDADGAVVLSDTAILVRPETRFVPVKEGLSMNKTVEELIQNTKTRFTENDRVWLEKLDETQLAALQPLEEKPADPDPKVNEEEKPAAPAPEPKVQTVTEYIAAAPPEMQEVLNSSLALLNQRRTDLIKGIMANSRNRFTEAALKAMKMDQLEAISSLATEPGDFAGQGVSTRVQSTVQANEAAPAPIAVFDLSKAAAK